MSPCLACGSLGTQISKVPISNMLKKGYQTVQCTLKPSADVHKLAGSDVEKSVDMRLKMCMTIK